MPLLCTHMPGLCPRSRQEAWPQGSSSLGTCSLSGEESVAIWRVPWQPTPPRNLT